MDDEMRFHDAKIIVGDVGDGTKYMFVVGDSGYWTVFSVVAGDSGPVFAAAKYPKEYAAKFGDMIAHWLVSDRSDFLEFLNEDLDSRSDYFYMRNKHRRGVGEWEIVVSIFMAWMHTTNIGHLTNPKALALIGALYRGNKDSARNIFENILGEKL